MSGPSLESVIAAMATSAREISAEAIINGQHYTVRRWRDGTIALRPDQPTPPTAPAIGTDPREGGRDE